MTAASEITPTTPAADAAGVALPLPSPPQGCPHPVRLPFGLPADGREGRIPASETPGVTDGQRAFIPAGLGLSRAVKLWATYHLDPDPWAWIQFHYEDRDDVVVTSPAFYDHPDLMFTFAASVGERLVGVTLNVEKPA